MSHIVTLLCHNIFFFADSEAICFQDILDASPHQRYVLSKVEDHQLKVLLDLSSSLANHARLLSLSSPHAFVPYVPYGKVSFLRTVPNFCFFQDYETDIKYNIMKMKMSVFVFND